MTLQFFKNQNSKPDNRMVEYNQAIKRLGFEKIDVEKQVEILKRQVKSLEITRTLETEAVLEQRVHMTDETKAIFDKKIKKLSSYELEISERTRRLKELEDKSITIDKNIADKEKSITETEKTLIDLDEKKVSLEKNITGLKDSQKSTLKNTQQVLAQAHLEERKKSDLVSEVYQLGLTKVELNNSLGYKHKELEELNEIISILRSSYKDGLLAVDFSAGENKRLQDKEEFLIRKEKDLAQYEKRVEKQREDAGISTPMIFT